MWVLVIGIIVGIGSLILTSGLVIFFSALLRAFVISQLWAWFVLTLFPEFPSLSLPAAFGISLLLNFLTFDYPSIEAKTPEEQKEEQRRKSQIELSEAFRVTATIILRPIVYSIMALLVSSLVYYQYLLPSLAR